jgi:hypothetical protein
MTKATASSTRFPRSRNALNSFSSADKTPSFLG